MSENGINTQHGVYQVLARTTRPQAFSQLVGQDTVAKILTGMLNSKDIPHAFLFTGIRGNGKTSSARILAKTLCCVDGPTATPCQTCIHCKQITEGGHTDVLEIDGASNTGVDNIRELRESALFFPNSARYRIFIIDEVHMLSTGAFNALLKILEEPPKQIVFILATTELHKVPATVRSRCVVLSFKKVPPEILAKHLENILTAEKSTFDNDSLTLIAREAKGSIRDSLSLLEQVKALCAGQHISLEKTKQALSILGQDLAENLMQVIASGSAAQAIATLREADATSVDLSILLEDTANLFRNALIIRTATDVTEARRITQLLPIEIEFLQSNTAHITHAALSELFRTLSLAARDVAKSPAGLAWAEISILDAINRREWLSASELLALSTSGKSVTFATNDSPKTILPIQTPKPQIVEPITTPSVNISLTPVISTTNNTNIDIKPDDKMVHFKNVIEIVQATSPRLAQKLKQAIIENFDEKSIQFSNSDTNKIFTSLNVTDAQIFLNAVDKYGFKSAEIKGMILPKEAKIPSSANKTSNNDELITTPLQSNKMQPTLAEIEKTQQKNDAQKSHGRILASPHLKEILANATNIEFTELDIE